MGSTRHPGRTKLLVGAVAAAVLLVGLLHAWQLRWVSEDAYISFRYARSLIEGQGLVFNPGERVEGYTNFLWTLVLALGLSTGLDPPAVSTVFGLGLMLITLSAHLRLSSLVNGPSLLPAAPFCLALNYTWACFATSGLETSLLCLLITLLFLVLVESPPALRSHRPVITAAAAGLLTALALMTRMDAVLLCPGVCLFFLLEEGTTKEKVQRVAVFTLAMGSLYTPYFLWRLAYYGDWLPNTFYAKSASLPYYDQGLIYLWEFIRRYAFWLWLPPVGYLCLAPSHRKEVLQPWFVMLFFFCVLHTFYVVRVGGDFMEGRFFVPILPFLYILFEYAVRRLTRGPFLRYALLLGLIGTAALSPRIIAPLLVQDGIADERTWEPVFQAWFREGVLFARHLPEETPIATDAIGAFGYSSRLPIIDILGLTDRTVARTPLLARSRPGHEKMASAKYLMDRGVAILRDGTGRYESETPPAFVFAGHRYFLLTQDPAVTEGFHRLIRELE